VLGPEEDAHVEARGEQRLRRGDEIERDGGGIAEKSDPLALKNPSRASDRLADRIAGGGGFFECAGSGLARRGGRAAVRSALFAF
jgi:hypothetical protein